MTMIILDITYSGWENRLLGLHVKSDLKYLRHGNATKSYFHLIGCSVGDAVLCLFLGVSLLS